jgi:hypothetical protein
MLVLLVILAHDMTKHLVQAAIRLQSTHNTVSNPSRRLTMISIPTTKKRKISAQELKEKEKDLWIKWITCQAREVILDDLRFGRLPRDAKEMSAKQAWSFYRNKPGFENVCFSQFKERLADHRKQVNTEWLLCKDDEEAFRKDQARGYKHTRSHNRRGELIIHLTPIDDLVREDVKNGTHKGLTPSGFQATRPEYRKIDNKKFKEKLSQEVRRQKFIFHCELERKNKGRNVPALYKRVN